MPYNKNYLFTHSIDWFACINGIWIHAASRGGLLPNRIDNEIILLQLQGICSNLPVILRPSDITINDELIEKRYRRAIEFYEQRLVDNVNDFQDFYREYNFESFRAVFSELFVEMACKGFYSFVRVDIDDPFSTDYSLVAYPKEDAQLHLSEILYRPYNSALIENEYIDYLHSISINDKNSPISLDANLDVLF